MGYAYIVDASHGTSQYKLAIMSQFHDLIYRYQWILVDILLDNIKILVKRSILDITRCDSL